MKPTDYVAFFKRKDHSDELTASIDSSTVAKTKNKYSTTTYTSVKKTSHEVSGKITAVNEPQENESYSYLMSINKSSLS